MECSFENNRRNDGWISDDFWGCVAAAGFIYLLLPRWYSIVSVNDLHFAASPTPEERISASLPCLQIFVLLLPQEKVCPVRWQPLSSVSGRKRYNTLDFASKIVCQQGASRPYWKPRAKGIASLWTPTFFFTRRYPNCKNAVCHRCEENTKGSLCARIVKAQFFLLVLIIWNWIWCNFRLSASAAAERIRKQPFIHLLSWQSLRILYFLQISRKLPVPNK